MPKNKYQNKSLTYRMVFIALMGALGYLISMIMIPYPLMPFLQIEVSEVVVICTSLLLGYQSGIMVALLKGFLHFALPFSATILIGEVVFTISSVIVALLTYFIYYRLSKRNLIVTLLTVSLIYTLLQCLSNYLFVLPLYENKSFSELNRSSTYWESIFIVYLPFNLLKMTLVSVISYLVGKKVFSIS